MRSRFGLLLVGIMACTSAGTAQEPGGPPEPTPEKPAFTPTPTPTPTPEATPTPPATAASVTVQMTAATLGDDCGGSPAASKEKSVPSRMKGDMARGARAKSVCEQSSMQLSVVAAADGAPTRLGVKKVELFDDKGAMLGELIAATPTVWDPSGVYQAWDQSVAPGQDLSVSYALSQPPWGDVSGRRSRTYVLKAVITIGDGEQTVQRDVNVAMPTILPPNVKT
jgi:hypothetical protein